MSTFVVIAFYKFVTLEHYEDLKEPLLKAMNQHAIKGTFILAHEGINTTFAGNESSVLAFVAELESLIPELKGISFRKTYHDTNPFSKAKVKLRKEIVTMGVLDVRPQEMTGMHVSPEEWNTLLASPDVVLVDTRNDYECVLGTFKGALNPKTDNFREFPEYVKEKLLDKKDKKIAMFCTGGVRCEKSTAYLLSLGFKNVYQLEGGILAYLERIAKEEQVWEGDCFVFDDRVALDAHLDGLAEGTLDKEWKNQYLEKKNG